MRSRPAASLEDIQPISRTESLKSLSSNKDTCEIASKPTVCKSTLFTVFQFYDADRYRRVLAPETQSITSTRQLNEARMDNSATMAIGITSAFTET
jgi:hypothetical protein